MHAAEKVIISTAITGSVNVPSQSEYLPLGPEQVVQASLDNVSASLSRLGTSSKAFTMHQSFVAKLQDTIDAGVGNLVDADLAKESAKFQALQTKQQLGIQALSIANQAPQSILSLFR